MNPLSFAARVDCMRAGPLGIQTQLATSVARIIRAQQLTRIFLKKNAFSLSSATHIPERSAFDALQIAIGWPENLL